MGLKEAFKKVGQAIEETKMKIGMKKYKKGGIQVEEKDQKPEMVIPVNDIPLPEEKKKTEDAEIRKIEDLPAYEDRKFYIAAKMQVEPEEVEKVISDAAVKLNMAFTEMMENIRQVADKISEIFRRIHENNTMTETQIRKRELWRRYYEEKNRMSNNERRRRGIPMVKRPKWQQYRPPKKKTTKG